jgi:putative CocE/NonD family hydrolase
MGPNEPKAAGNYWTSMKQWPTFKPLDYYFQTDGTLSTSNYKTVANSSFVYDPSNPIPTIGGSNLQLPCGPLDQQKIEAPFRKDVLTFTSPVLTQHLPVTGPINAVLFVASNCSDTDFTVKITDVFPSGESRIIQDGAVRMRWRNVRNCNIPQTMVPGQIYKAEVSLWNTSYVWNIGHRIRVSISSSNYPRYSVNPNNGLPLIQNGPLYWARNTVVQSEKFPSRITLPVVSFSQLPEVKVHSERDKIMASPAAMKTLLRIASANGAAFDYN